MRISDWSSDVCSSDLRHFRIVGCGANKLGLDHRAAVEMRKQLRIALPPRNPLAARLVIFADRIIIDGIDMAPVRRDALIGLGRRDRRKRQEHGGEHQKRSEEHTSELQSLMRISYSVFCLKKKKNRTHTI